MQIVSTQRTLDRSVVLALVDEIDGEGGAMLDAEKLVDQGLPIGFVSPLVETITAGELAIRDVDVAGPHTVLRAVWSLGLLRALIRHYNLDDAEPYMGHGRNAEVLTERLRKHLRGDDEQ